MSVRSIFLQFFSHLKNDLNNIFRLFHWLLGALQGASNCEIQLGTKLNVETLDGCEVWRQISPFSGAESRNASFSSSWASGGCDKNEPVTGMN